MNKHFEHIVLLGRPASGKSEMVDYLKSVPVRERLEKFHVGNFVEIDDFPWLWQKFEDDDIWERAGYLRRFSKYYEDGNKGLSPDGAPLFDWCMEKFNTEIEKRYLSNPDFYKENTLFIEFSRGNTRTYSDSLSRLKSSIWKRAAILYIDVSGEESKRRNIKRYEEKKKASILAHKVPEELLEAHYKTDDWHVLTGGKEGGCMDICGIRAPFVTMGNEPELPPGPEIGERYRRAFEMLFKLCTLF